jgi:hypothetical protein
MGEFNRRFAVPAAERGSAFLRLSRLDLDRLFSIQHKQVVNRDNTVRLDNRVLQIEPTRWRGTLAGCRVTVCEHFDETLSILYGPHVVGRYTAEGRGVKNWAAARRGAGPPTPAPRPQFISSQGGENKPNTTGQIMCYKKRTFSCTNNTF